MLLSKVSEVLTENFPHNEGKKCPGLLYPTSLGFRPIRQSIRLAEDYLRAHKSSSAKL